MRAVIGALHEQAFGQVPQTEFQLRFRHFQHLLQVGESNAGLPRMQATLLVEGGDNGLPLLARLAHALRGCFGRGFHNYSSAESAAGMTSEHEPYQ